MYNFSIQFMNPEQKQKRKHILINHSNYLVFQQKKKKKWQWLFVLDKNSQNKNKFPGPNRQQAKENKGEVRYKQPFRTTFFQINATYF